MSAISPSPSALRSDLAAVKDIDASCRVPLFVLFNSAILWAAVASVFGLIASIKFHGPGFLANCAWLTYGRVHAVAVNAFLYGFAIQAGLGVALWIFTRLGGNPVSQPWLTAAGAKLWNIGVTVGVIAILAGDGTGFEYLEMPRYAAVILFLGYLLIGTCLAFTLHRRRAPLEPPQWFLIAALFWFPWIFSTAHAFLTFWPVRGVTQAVVSWWFAGNLNLVWIGLAGLAVVFYFMTTLTNRPLHSRYLAFFSFWTLILFASWSGIPNSAPVPAWMPTLSSIATMMTVLTVLSVALNIYKTVGRGCEQSENPPPGKFIAFAALSFVIAWVMNIASVLPDASRITMFTWFNVGQWQLNVYGFFAMALFGAIYYIVPRVTGLEWPAPKLVRAHFFVAAAGVVLIVLPLAIGGLIQGIKLNNPQVPFVDLAKTTLHFLRISTIGELLLLLGHVFLLGNLVKLTVHYYKTHFAPLYADVTRELKPAEVKP